MTLLRLGRISARLELRRVGQRLLGGSVGAALGSAPRCSVRSRS